MTTADLIILLVESIQLEKPKGIAIQEGFLDKILGRGPVLNQGEWQQIAAKAARVGMGWQKLDLKNKEPEKFALICGQLAKSYIKDEGLNRINEHLLNLLGKIEGSEANFEREAHEEALRQLNARKITVAQLGAVKTSIIKNKKSNNPARVALAKYVDQLKATMPTIAGESIEDIANTITEDISINNGRILE